MPSPVSAFCLPDTPDCPDTLCDDGDVCTYDFHTPTGCRSEPAADGIPCPQLDSAETWCAAGVCQVPPTAGP